MAVSTRLKVSNQTTLYHRYTASNDAPQTDVGTTEALASQLGSSADLELIAESDTADLDVVDQSFVVVTGSDRVSETSLALPAGSFIYFKHTGFEDAALTNPTTDTLAIGVGGTAVNAVTSLYPGESVFFHAPFGTGADALADWDLKSSGSDDIYVQIITGVDGS